MKAQTLKRLINWYPPYLGAGIRVTKLAPDFSEIRVAMKLRWYNRNYVGTHFGGSLYAMVDPFFMLMLMNQLGRDYVVWDQSARIEFLKPGRGTVTARFRIPPQVLSDIRSRADGGERVRPKFKVAVRDQQADTVARAEKTLYVRRKRPGDDSKGVLSAGR